MRPGTLQRLLLRTIIAIVVMAGIIAILSAMQGKTVEAISITLRAGEVEPVDKVLPLVGNNADALPDYKIYVSQRSRPAALLVGSKTNQRAADGLTFALTTRLRRGDLQSIIIKEQNTLHSDTIDGVEIEHKGTHHQGKLFSYELTEGFSMGAGLGWFFSTRVGMVVAGFLILIALMLILLYGGVPDFSI